MRATVAARLFVNKPLFLAALQHIAATAATQLAAVPFIHTAAHTYHGLGEYRDVQAAQRDGAAKSALEAAFDSIESRTAALCKAVAKTARLYQESVRTAAELHDTTGVELASGVSVTSHRGMAIIRAEKEERARTYRRIMQEERLLGNFVRLVDYMCSEASMARAVDSVAAVVAQLRAPRLADGDKVAKGTFVAVVDFEEEGMAFAPPQAAVRTAIHGDVIEGAALLACPPPDPLACLPAAASRQKAQPQRAVCRHARPHGGGAPHPLHARLCAALSRQAVRPQPAQHRRRSAGVPASAGRRGRDAGGRLRGGGRLRQGL